MKKYLYIFFILLMAQSLLDCKVFDSQTEPLVEANEIINIENQQKIVNPEVQNDSKTFDDSFPNSNQSAQNSSSEEVKSNNNLDTNDEIKKDKISTKSFLKRLKNKILSTIKKNTKLKILSLGAATVFIKMFWWPKFEEYKKKNLYEKVSQADYEKLKYEENQKWIFQKFLDKRQEERKIELSNVASILKAKRFMDDPEKAVINLTENQHTELVALEAMEIMDEQLLREVAEELAKFDKENKALREEKILTKKEIQKSINSDSDIIPSSKNIQTSEDPISLEKRNEIELYELRTMPIKKELLDGMLKDIDAFELNIKISQDPEPASILAKKPRDSEIELNKFKQVQKLVEHDLNIIPSSKNIQASEDPIFLKKRNEIELYELRTMPTKKELLDGMLKDIDAFELNIKISQDPEPGINCTQKQENRQFLENIGLELSQEREAKLNQFRQIKLNQFKEVYFFNPATGVNVLSNLDEQIRSEDEEFIVNMANGICANADKYQNIPGVSNEIILYKLQIESIVNEYIKQYKTKSPQAAEAYLKNSLRNLNSVYTPRTSSAQLYDYISRHYKSKQNGQN